MCCYAIKDRVPLAEVIFPVGQIHDDDDRTMLESKCACVCVNRANTQMPSEIGKQKTENLH